MGTSFLLLFSMVDSSVKLSNDKSTLLDKSWHGAVVKHFSNPGKAFQNMKKLKDVIDL